MVLSDSLRLLTKALPVPGRAFLLRTQYNSSLINSFFHLLEACEDVLSKDIYSGCFSKLQGLNPENKVSAFLSILHKELLSAIEKEDLQSIEQIARHVQEGNFQVLGRSYLNLSQLDDHYSALLEQNIRNEVDKPVRFQTLSSEEAHEMEDIFGKAFATLESVLPDFYHESQDLISEILFINEKTLRDGSSADFFGLIFVSHAFKWRSLTEALAILTHEQAHLYVYLLGMQDPLMDNPSERYESPLRKDPRPLMGIYHATFVLARIYHVLQTVLRLKEIPQAEFGICKELMEYYKKRCLVGMDVLKDHAKLTPMAKDLITSASQLIA